MHWVNLVAVLALIQYMAFAVLAGRARVKGHVPAPATAGDAMFERAFRVQMNTLEQLVAFLPALWLTGYYWSDGWAAAIGAVYLIGRLVYRQRYMADPASRAPGFILTVLPNVLLLLAALAGAIRALAG